MPWYAILIFTGSLALMFALGRFILDRFALTVVLLLNALGGAILLYAVAFLSPTLGLSVEVNPLSLIMSAAMGVPGVALVMVLNAIIA